MVTVLWNKDLLPAEYNSIDIDNVMIRFYQYSGRSIKKGSLVCTAFIKAEDGNLWRQLFQVFSPADGFLKKASPVLSLGGDEYYSDNSELFSIYSLEETSSSLDYFYKIDVDPYTKNKKIMWSSSGGRFQDHLFFCGLAFEYNNSAFLTMKVWRDYFRPKKKDNTLFLFEDEDVLSFRVDNQPIKDKHDYLISFALSKSELVKFCSKRVASIRLESTTVAPYEYKLFANGSNELGEVLFMKYARRFNAALDEVGFSWPAELNDDLPKTSDEPCYVYLMVDTTNGYHKIGISNHPEYREGTLQSEKPTIELLCAKQFPSRVIAKAIESALHKTYEDKHLRGEWFQLDAKDIIDLMATLK